MTTKPVRILRNLKINEVSGVDRGAGRGVKIMLMKRDTQEDTMTPQTTFTVAKSANMWTLYCDLIRKRDNCTRSEAINRALATETGAELFSLAKVATAADVCKDSSDGDSSPQQTAPVYYPPQVNEYNDGSHQEQLADTLARAGITSGAENLARLRAAHAALNRFNKIVDEHVSKGMKRSAAQMKAMKENPDLFQSAKTAKGMAAVGDVHVPGSLGRDRDGGRSPTMLPLSHDGNAQRARG
jgi:hypothetical protein